ncbi:MAG: RNA polymerase sigma factor [Verrucomicrobiales bacterium]
MQSISENSPTAALLELWVRERSEAAFATLVERYSGMVYATAMRATAGRADLSADISQQVFIALAEMAPALKRDERLGGWLHRRSSWTACKLLRSERRREKRERGAAMDDQKPLATNDETPAEEWTPHLDAALQRLKKTDRDAIILRYLEGRDLRSVGEAIGASEDAARKRVARSLEKLRKVITGRGFTLSAGTLLGVITQPPASAVPATALVGQWSSASLAAAKATGPTPLLYRWLVPATSAGLGATIALVAAPLLASIKVGDVSNSNSDTVPGSVIKSVDGSRDRRLTSPAPKPSEQSGLDVATFVQELDEVLDLPESSPRRRLLNNLFELAPNDDPLGLGRAILAGIEPLKIGDVLPFHYGAYAAEMQIPAQERFKFLLGEWPVAGLLPPLSHAFRDWLEEDPESAIAWIDGFKRDKAFGKVLYDGRGLSKILFGHLKRHVRNAGDIGAALALEVEWVNAGDATLNVRNLKLKSESDFHEAWAALGEIESPGLRKRSLRELSTWAASEDIQLTR